MAEEVTATFDLKIDEHEFEFLKIQRGRINDLAGDRVAWKRAYLASLQMEYCSIAQFLPATCERLLDIGSGLGGIDILISRHYPDPPMPVLFDGDEPEPVMNRHGKPFSNMAAAVGFLAKNGIPRFVYQSVSGAFPEGPFDLVVSFASWCFHYCPELYLDRAIAAAAPGAIFIIDVRRDYKTWHRILEQALEPIDIAWQNEKIVRRVFRVR